MRTARALLVIGCAGVLVALSPQDYARLASATDTAARRAAALIDKHVVVPIRIVVTHRLPSPPSDAKSMAPPAPRPAIRPSLVSDEARRNLAEVRIAPAPSAVHLDQPAEPIAAVPKSPAAAEVSRPALVGTQQDAVPQKMEVQPAASVATANAVIEAGDAIPPTAPAVAPEPAPPAATAEPVATAAAATQAVANVQTEEADTPPPGPANNAEGSKQKEQPVAARLLFGAVKSSAPLASRAIGYYSRGCLAGAKALPVDGSAWQAMRLTRNRNWGHPRLVELIERFANDVQKEAGWPGILVGDMSQPRGGPMLTGHSSHQIGLDADIWFTPMPARRLSKSEREDLSATSMLDGPLKVDQKVFTPSHVKVVKRAASYSDVERILVHPAIKKALCEAAGTDRAWLAKVRPYFGHFYHFHVRIGCPKGSEGCKSQAAPPGDDGCGKELDDWFARLTRPPAPKPPGYKPPPPKPPITLADMPLACRVVLTTGREEIIKDEAALIKMSAERSKSMIDISGKRR